MSTGVLRQERTRPTPARSLVRNVPLLRAMTLGLLAAASLAAGGSLLRPDLLRGVAVVDGNLRGTAFVVLTIGLPLALFGLWRTTVREDPRGLVALLGAATYLTYQGVMFCFATPFNALFLSYVALLGSGIWTLIIVVSEVDSDAVASSVGARTPYRAVSAALFLFAGLNTLAWLARILPAVVTGDPAAGIEGSGLPTNPVWVQDLAFWLPAAFVVGSMMWRRRPLGVLLAEAMLAFYVVESLSVASDQWWGVQADSGEPTLASLAAVPGALIVAGLTLVPLVWGLRHLTRT